MQYKILDLKTIDDYINGIKTLSDYFGGDKLEVKEIGDGNLNFVFIVQSVTNNDKAVILKQAVPYLRCVGEDFPLGRQRMTYEIRSLLQYESVTPQHTPKIYDANEGMSAIVMQYLGAHIIMRKGLINSVIYPNFAEHISTFLAENLFKTSSLYLDSTKKRELIDSFNQNSELCKLTEDFVFTFAFMENETNDTNANGNIVAQKLFADMEFKKGILNLKYKFMTQNDALLHGDLHTGSIMVNKKETFVIDSEFSFIGPFGFDIGALIANLILSYVSHTHLDSDKTYANYILDLIENILSKFEEKFLILWEATPQNALHVEGFIDELVLKEFKKEFMKNILQDSIGFAGAKMSRRIFGIAGVEDVRGIEDKNIRAKVEEEALEIAKRFVKNYKNVQNINDVKEMIL